MIHRAEATPRTPSDMLNRGAAPEAGKLFVSLRAGLPYQRITLARRSVISTEAVATIRPMSKAELHRQIDSMTEEEAAEVKLIYAPDWPSRATSIEEVRKRLGTEPMSPEDFDRHFGSLPTDGEG